VVNAEIVPGREIGGYIVCDVGGVAKVGIGLEDRPDFDSALVAQVGYWSVHLVHERRTSQLRVWLMVRGEEDFGGITTRLNETKIGVEVLQVSRSRYSTIREFDGENDIATISKV